MDKSLNILVAPLDWGLGHASRCMPIIDKLLEMDVNVFIGSNGRAAQFLIGAYPSLTHIGLPSYDVHYSSGSSQIYAISKQLPRIIGSIRKEQRQLGKLIDKYGLHGIISDNRYGLWSEKIPSVIICHQLAIRLPAALRLFQKTVFRLHKKLIGRFDHCWIPDEAGENGLSGKLTRNYPLPASAQYIGILSRFLEENQPATSASYRVLAEQEVDLLAVLSGPEPQRSILEEKLIGQVRKTDKKLWIVQGKPECHQWYKDDQISRIPSLQAADLALLLRKASVVISRPGYSSLMDFAALGLKKMILIPTPGQTEQEYLAEELARRSIAIVSTQDSFDLRDCLFALDQTGGFEDAAYQSVFISALEKFLLKCSSVN